MPIDGCVVRSKSFSLSIKNSGIKMVTPLFVQERFPEIKAGGYDRFDGSVHFYTRVNALLRPEFTVLDFGAGRGVSHIEDDVEYRRELLNIRGKVKQLIGADVDEVVTTNQNIDRAIVLNGPHIPLPDVSIDLILSDFTFEHLTDPDQAVAELDRVLKPGGWICARTPNRFGYISLMNRIIVGGLKDRVLRRAQPFRKEEDVFPAYYRLNTLKSLFHHFPSSRFDHATYEWDALPSYHFGRKWLHRTFELIHYLSPRGFRTILFIFIRKKDDLPD